MKKRLLCLLLILIVAFSFAACNVEENDDNDVNQNASTSGGTTNVTPDLGEDDLRPSERKDLECIAPNFGEKGYEEHIFEKLYPASHTYTNDEALITSVSELDEFLKVEHVRESDLFDPSHTGIHDTLYTGFNDKVASYTSEYFEENAVIVIFRSAASGLYWYSVKDVESQENTVNVTLQYWETASATCDMNYWGIIIECPKGNFDKLNVVTEIKEQQRRASSYKLYLGLTHEVSLETIYHDYTAEDFSELDFEFIVEDLSAGLRDKIGQLLIEHPIDYWEKSADYWNRETIKSYTRMLVIKLTVENTENVLRAVELLTKRADIEWAEPEFVYYFEKD